MYALRLRGFKSTRMLDDTTKRSRVIRAALTLAELDGWWALSMVRIADEAGVSIAEMQREFANKTDILRAFSAELDGAVLSQAQPEASEPARDRLFDVLMTRFEVMEQFKGALRAINQDFRSSPITAAALVDLVFNSQYWMLNAAGINAEAPSGALRVTGLAVVYGGVMQVWLGDDDPGHARTMAALDKELRRGERTLKQLNAAISAMCRLRARACDAVSACQRGRPAAESGDGLEAGERPSATGPGPTAAGPHFAGNGSGLG